MIGRQKPVTFEAAGATWTLTLDLNALSDFETVIGRNPYEVMTEWDNRLPTPTEERALFWAMLQEHHEGTDLRAAGRLADIQPEDYIFTALTDAAERLPHVTAAETAQPLSRQLVNQIVKRLAGKAGLRAEMVTVHTLRRTAARRFYEASDFDLDETAKALHHSNTATTRVYLNQPERGAREIWNTVAALYGL
jgi:integrase